MTNPEQPRITRSSPPTLWLQGTRTALGPFIRELAELYWQWENEPNVIAGLGRQTPESLEARLAGYDAQVRSMGNNPRFTIYDLTIEKDPVPVGTSALRIDLPVRTAEFFILLGAPGRGRRLAAEATRLTLDYALPHHPTQISLATRPRPQRRCHPRLPAGWLPASRAAAPRRILVRRRDR